jgi:hypothetical protein
MESYDASWVYHHAFVTFSLRPKPSGGRAVLSTSILILLYWLCAHIQSSGIVVRLMRLVCMYPFSLTWGFRGG